MPQFELEDVGPSQITGLYRGRTAQDAVTKAVSLPTGAVVEFEDEPDLHGWMEVRIEGAPAGRIRPHQRMRFRRD